MDIRQQLPIRLKRRFDSIGAFVASVVTGMEEEKGVPKKRRLPASVKSDISLLVFVFSLRQFLREGSRAAEAAAKESIRLGLSGFQVGEQVFEPGNDNTLRGQRLSEALWEQIKDQRIRNLLESEHTLTGLTEKLYVIAKEPEDLDRYRNTQG